MSKCIAICTLMLAVLIGFVNAECKEQTCGVCGTVYDHNGSPAGTKLYTINVIRLDESGSANYSYDTFNSHYNVGCGEGLVAGDWFIYAETIEGGNHYYSSGFAFYDWYPHFSLGTHNLSCDLTSPPDIPFPD